MAEIGEQEVSIARECAFLAFDRLGDGSLAEMMKTLNEMQWEYDHSSPRHCTLFLCKVLCAEMIYARKAQAIEAEGQDAETGLVRKDESAVPQGCAKDED